MAKTPLADPLQIIFGLAFIALSSPTFAWDNQNIDPYNNDPYKQNGDPNYRYRGNSGTQYQYDLSRPSDQLRYEVDLKAQMKDELSVDPRRELDQGLGQYGGGIQH